MSKIAIFLSLLIICSCKNPVSEKSIEPIDSTSEDSWETIFNGQDLTGWIPKISGYPVGENYANTFRVIDSAIVVSYDGYEKFSGEFGHLFYKEDLSHYKLKLQYKFFGEQVNGGESWALRNSGVMYHGQPAATMQLDQSFPVCLEGQFLGGNGKDERSTGNLCTPGTHVKIDGNLIEEHCISSTSDTYHGEQWVDFELIVRGDSIVHHIVNGDTVFTLTDPIISETFENEGYILKENMPLTNGTISLQSESHPVAFRKIQLLRLDNID